MSNILYVKLIGWSDDEFSKLAKHLDDINSQWITIDSKNIEQEHNTQTQEGSSS